MKIGLPRSLRGRTLLLTIAGIIACELITLGVLAWYRNALLTGRAHDFVNGQIEMVRALLVRASPEDVARELDRPGRRGMLRVLPPSRFDDPQLRERLRERFGMRERAPGDAGGDDKAAIAPRPPSPQADDWLLLGPRDRSGPRPIPRIAGAIRLVESPPDDATTTIPRDMALPQLASTLRSEYGVDALRFTHTPEPVMWLRVAPSNWWLMLPVSRYSSPPIPWPVVLAVLAAVAAMGGLVALYSVHLSRPLRSLAEAASTYTIGKRTALPLSGPDEIRAVTEQFNAMAERLERDDAERRVMLAGLPHDLRAPLARAKLRLELMDGGGDGVKEGLTRDLAEVERIADQFVAYLRGLDRDTSRFADEPLDDLVRDRGAVWRDSGHDVTVASADACRRPIDADALLRAIDNLVGNAFAHGKAPVTIAGTLDGDRYRIAVRDRGPGIPVERRAFALQPFTRLDAARGASGHCGLGLAVAQSVARLHDGSIEFGDVEGGGLEVAIVLPVAGATAS